MRTGSTCRGCSRARRGTGNRSRSRSCLTDLGVVIADRFRERFLELFLEAFLRQVADERHDLLLPRPQPPAAQRLQREIVLEEAPRHHEVVGAVTLAEGLALDPFHLVAEEDLPALPVLERG